MELTSSPGRSPVNLGLCMEELLKFTLQSYIDGTLCVDLSFCKEFCSYILNQNSSDLTSDSTDYSQESFQIYLYKDLSAALCEVILSKTTIDTDSTLNQNVEWNKLVIDKVSEILNILKAINFELHVQEPFFKQLRDGQKTIEGRCAAGDYNRIEAGALILFNQCLVLEVQDIHYYPSFSEMLKAEPLEKVLPGVKTIKDGVGVYRRFYSEEKEMSNGVVAICVAKSVVQPYDILARILSYPIVIERFSGTVSDYQIVAARFTYQYFGQELGENGIQSILEFYQTAG